MSLRYFWVLPLSALLLGCPPKIGNKCSISTDCSQLGDRLCDPTQPDGYCTIFNCEPDQCPDSVCVAFDPSLDPACKNADEGRWPRFERTYCMKACSSDGDCRDGYQCVDLTPLVADPNDATKLISNPNLSLRRAEVVDIGAVDGGFGYGVCMVSGPSLDGGSSDGTSSGGDGGIPPVCKPNPDLDGGVPWTPVDAGAGGAGP